MANVGLVVWRLLCLLKEYQGIELCAKLLFQTELIRTRRDQEFGFTVEAKVADSSFQSDELCVFVSDVAKGGPVAQKKGTNTVCRDISLASDGATPGRTRSNDLAARSTALVPPCLLLCFGNSVNRNRPLYIYYKTRTSVHQKCKNKKIKVKMTTQYKMSP